MSTNPPRIVCSHVVHAEVRERLLSLGRLVENRSTVSWTPTELAEQCVAADALVAFMSERVDAAFLDSCPRLRVVAGAFKGYDNIDLAACAARGVTVTYVPDLLTEPTAELAVALLLGVNRQLLTVDAVVRGGGFTGWRPICYGRGLSGTTVGIYGYGAVGQALARRLRPFGARVAACDPAYGGGDAGVAALDFATMLTACSQIVSCAPLTPTTHHAFDATAIASMQPGAVLVNVGRGSVVDEAAVAAALRDGRLGAYAADVFECEDRSRGDPPTAVPEALREASRTLFTPHLGSAVGEVRLAIEHRAVDNLQAALAGQEPPDKVPRAAAPVCSGR